MIIETRVWNVRTKKMVYFKPLQPMGDAVFGLPVTEGLLPELDANDPIMIKTPVLDKNSVPIWEGDIVECGILTSYGAIKDMGIMIWRGDLNQFTVQVHKMYEGERQFNITDVLRVGNIYEDMELAQKIKEQNDENKPADK